MAHNRHTNSHSFEQLRDIAIEILNLDISPAYATNKRTLARYGYSFEDAFCDSPPIGVSLGTVGSGDSGTLGGYLRVRAKSAAGAEKTKYLALTCHHVLSSK